MEAALGEALTPSRLAVLHSHMRAQRRFLASRGAQIGLFLEDDVMLAPHVVGTILPSLRMGSPDRTDSCADTKTGNTGTRIHEALLRNWSLLHLGYCWEHCTVLASRSARPLSSGGWIRNAVQPLCLHGFASTRETSRRLLSAIQPPFTAPVDVVWAKRLIRPQRVHAQIVTPPLLVQSRSSGVTSPAKRKRVPLAYSHEQTLYYCGAQTR